MQVHELACNYISLHAVAQVCMQFLSLSEQLTRISQCLFYLIKLTYRRGKPRQSRCIKGTNNCEVLPNNRKSCKVNTQKIVQYYYFRVNNIFLFFRFAATENVFSQECSQRRWTRAGPRGLCPARPRLQNQNPLGEAQQRGENRNYRRILLL